MANLGTEEFAEGSSGVSQARENSPFLGTQLWVSSRQCSEAVCLDSDCAESSACEQHPTQLTDFQGC